MQTLLLIHLLATGFMTGLIWFVQVVHYPLFNRVGSGAFVAYENEHTRRTTWVVAPVMLIEASCTLALLVHAQGRSMQFLASIGAALLLMIWLATAAVQVPCHRVLCRGFEQPVARRLAATNWVRTLAWTARSFIAVVMVAQASAMPVQVI